MTHQTSSLPTPAQIILGDQSVQVTDVRSRGARAANAFRALGLKEGDVVAILLRNEPAFIEAQIAAGMIGIYVVPINWHSTAEEAGYILRDCKAAALVIHADLLAAVEPEIPFDVVVLVVPTPDEIADAYNIREPLRSIPVEQTNWTAWLYEHPPLNATLSLPPAAMIYTSGTTGRPKGVRRNRPTAEQFAATLAHHAVVYGLTPTEPIVALMTAPLYHSAPNAYARSALHCGATIVLSPRADPEEILQLIEQHRITHMYAVPTLFVRLLKLSDEVKRRYDLSSLRFVVHGAAPCAPSVKQAMIEWWGPVINEIYGATEVGVTAWNNSEDALRKPGTVGRVVHGAVIKVLDEQGAELPPGRIGELYMRANWLPEFTYHGLDDRRREVSRGDLTTVGDLGWIDADGYVFVCDRKRDMVISGGVNIYPAEIESVLIGLDGVKDCAVFGIPDEEFGEALCSYVELDHAWPTPLTSEAIRAHLESHVAKFKVPKRIEIVPSLPREETGKILKRKLRDPYWEKAGRKI